MKLLVTDGAVCIGSAVVRLAVARGHQVVNLYALTYEACLQKPGRHCRQPALCFRACGHS